MRWQLSDIPTGEAGTVATVQKIAAMVADSLRRPLVRLTALHILERANTTPRNDYQAARAIHKWVRAKIRYVKDPLTVETVQAPEVTLKLKAGDCDDHAGLVAALAMSIGIPARLVVVGHAAGEFIHIYAELFINGNWLPADSTTRSPLGTAPQMPAKKIFAIGATAMSYTVGLADPVTTVPVKRAEIKRRAYQAATQVMKSNWNNGLINAADVRSYLRVIDEGNSPARGTILEPVIRKAITDFLAFVQGRALQSKKPAGLSGLEGLGGFLKSIWNGVKKAVGAVVKTAGKVVGAVVGGGSAGGGTVEVKLPTISTTPAQVNVNPSAEAAGNAAREGINALLSNPVVLIGGALALIILLKK